MDSEDQFVDPIDTGPLNSGSQVNSPNYFADQFVDSPSAGFFEQESPPILLDFNSPYCNATNIPYENDFSDCDLLFESCQEDNLEISSSPPQNEQSLNRKFLENQSLANPNMTNPNPPNIFGSKGTTQEKTKSLATSNEGSPTGSCKRAPKRKVDLSLRAKLFKYAFYKIFTSNKKKFPKELVIKIHNFICRYLPLPIMSRELRRNIDMYFDVYSQYSEIILCSLQQHKEELLEAIPELANL